MAWSTIFKSSESVHVPIYKLILSPPVAAGTVEDLETLWTGPWDIGYIGLKSSVKSEMLFKFV